MSELEKMTGVAPLPRLSQEQRFSRCSPYGKGRRILLTGFTGVMGKRYAYRLAEAGFEVLCLLRAESLREAKERRDSVLESLSRLLPDFREEVALSIKTIAGDVREPGLGLDKEGDIRFKIEPVEEVWHLAAALDLTETNSQNVYHTNLLGTLNVLEFMRRHDIPSLQYFSTFGSSGAVREGIVREVAGAGTPHFRNTYERTKFEAERFVWKEHLEGRIRATIYRPSIVVGDSTLGRYEQFNVFNHPFDVCSRLRRNLMEKSNLDPKRDILRYSLRLPGKAEATLNVIPLDYAIDCVMRLHRAPRSSGFVYHIVNPNPPTLQEAMDVFTAQEPWEGIRWEDMSSLREIENPYENFVAHQLAFLGPYLQGEAYYDYTNTSTALAFHGGLPKIDNVTFLSAIARRAQSSRWQEGKPPLCGETRNGAQRQLSPDTEWPQAGDLLPRSQESLRNAKPIPYSLTDRLAGRAYAVKEKLRDRIKRRREHTRPADIPQRDLVLVPFGLGVTRPQEGEALCFKHNRSLAEEVISFVSQVVGYDLRAVMNGETVPDEKGNRIHGQLMFSFTDNLIHLMRLIADLKRIDASGFKQRLQILPYSAGFYPAGWLTGITSFDDMILIAHQCAKLMWDGEEEASRKERLRDKKTGRLEIVLSLGKKSLAKLVDEIGRAGLGVSYAIKMSANAIAVGGDASSMDRFGTWMDASKSAAFKRISTNVQGSPHCSRLSPAAGHTTRLLQNFEQKGRLKNPILPLYLHTGETISKGSGYIQALAGINDQFCDFEKMIRNALSAGGRRFLFLQSGLAASPGDFFEGVFRQVANDAGIPGIEIHRPKTTDSKPHPALAPLGQTTTNRATNDEPSHPPLRELVSWYDAQS